MSTKNKSKLNFRQEWHGLRYRIWSYFAIFAVSLIVLVWVFNIILNNVSYKRFKLNDVKRAAENICQSINNADDDLDAQLPQLHATASRAGMETYVFHLSQDISFANPIFYCNPFTPYQPNPSPVIITAEQQQLFAQYYNGLRGSTTASRIVNNDNSDEKLLIYYRTFEDGYFLYASTPLLASAGNMRVMSAQLMWVTVTALIMALFASYLLARRLGNPIVNMSKEARKLARGDYSVHFVGNGYNEIDELSEALNYATDELSKITTLRKDVVANVSHDLKTPLTLIKSYAELIKDFPDAPMQKQEERLNLIIKETDRVTQLINEMVKLTLSERGDLQLQMERFNLSALVQSVADMFAVKKEEGYTFKTVIAADLHVCADRGQIQQVLYNYLSNAFAYTGNDKKVIIELKDLGSKVRFDCYDTGKGLTDNDKAHVWDRFYRGSQQYTRSSGTGLGLAICKNILQLHDAVYGVNSVLGKGSDFYFELPLCVQLPESQQE